MSRALYINAQKGITSDRENRAALRTDREKKGRE